MRLARVGHQRSRTVTEVYRTAPKRAAVGDSSGWLPFGDDLEITAAPLIDSTSGGPTFARLTYSDALEVAARIGARLLTQAEHDRLWAIGRRLLPVIMTPGPRMASLEYAKQHDAKLAKQLAGWDGSTPLANAGKQWVHGAPKGRAWNYGWWDLKAPNGRMWQTLGTTHDDQHTDYSQLTMLVRPRSRGVVHSLFGAVKSAASGIAAVAVAAYRSALGDPSTTAQEKPMRPTIGFGSTGQHVTAWQRVLGLTGLDVDGVFGEGTKFKTEQWQAARGLVADGVVGAKSWIAAGETPLIVAPSAGVDPRAPACVAALRDANAAWPARSRRSDGIMGDAAHQARPSDHNLGNAVDITHDPASGADGELIASMAIQDARTTYVIWNREIYSRARAAEGWRKYTGSNPHTHHVHISVRADARDDASPWPWAA